MTILDYANYTPPTLDQIVESIRTARDSLEAVHVQHVTNNAKISEHLTSSQKKIRKIKIARKWARRGI